MRNCAVRALLHASFTVSVPLTVSGVEHSAPRHGIPFFLSTECHAEIKNCRGDALDEKTVQRWLQRYGEAVRDLLNLENRLDAVRSSAGDPRTTSIDGMPHGSGYSADSLGLKLARVDRLEAEVARKHDEAAEIETEITEAVDRITGRGAGDMRMVIMSRYIDGQQWPDICFSLFGDSADYDDKEESYLRRTFGIHKRALQELSKIILED